MLDFSLPGMRESWPKTIERYIRQAQDLAQIDTTIDAAQAAENFINGSIVVHERFLHKLDRVDLVNQLWQIWLPLLRGIGVEYPERFTEHVRNPGTAPA